MSNYFRGANIGLIMGFWAGDSNFGDVLGLMIGDVVVDKLSMSYNWGTLICAGYLLIIGLSVILFLDPAPKSDIGLLEENSFVE
jgi:OPA family glycerol-3-phosphate transporter-like MFS transporter 3